MNEIYYELRCHLSERHKRIECSRNWAVLSLIVHRRMHTIKHFGSRLHIHVSNIIGTHRLYLICGKEGLFAVEFLCSSRIVNTMQRG
jgi:hypothetical protein